MMFPLWDSAKAIGQVSTIIGCFLAGQLTQISMLRPLEISSDTLPIQDEAFSICPNLAAYPYQEAL